MPATRLAGRVLSRLAQAEACELNPHYRDDLRIARLTVAYAASGEAVLCSPDVLASYVVLGLHPQKVWPAIQARRKALGLREETGAPPVPKKAAQSVKLWYENRNGARAANSRAGATVDLRDQTISVPMAAPSIAALFPNPAQPSSAKTREFTLDEIKRIVGYSGAPGSICALTISALRARGEWPNQDGPATTILSVAILGMMLEGVCCRRTVQRRIKRAVQLGYWRRVHDANSWSNCPKCGKKRTVAKCDACPYRGRSKDANGRWTGEFMRVPVYEFDLHKFRSAQRCREIRHFEVRSYAELKTANRPNVAAWPSRTAPDQSPPPKAPAPARPEEPRRKTAEQQKLRTVVETQISGRATQLAQRVYEVCGLADIGAIAQIAISIVAEAKFRGVELQEAAKHIADCAVRDQKNGITLTRFYFRDSKWRTSNGGRQNSASAERAERSKRNILDGLLANARGPDAPDGTEREE